MGKCPQDFCIHGHSSKRFQIDCVIPHPTTDHQLLVEAIVYDLMDAVGDTFIAYITFTRDNHAIINMVFMHFEWIIVMSEKMSKFQSFLGKGILRIEQVRVCKSEPYDHEFILSVKNGILCREKRTGNRFVEF